MINRLESSLQQAGVKKFFGHKDLTNLGLCSTNSLDNLLNFSGLPSTYDETDSGFLVSDGVHLSVDFTALQDRELLVNGEQFSDYVLETIEEAIDNFRVE